MMIVHTTAAFSQFLASVGSTKARIRVARVQAHKDDDAQQGDDAFDFSGHKFIPFIA